MARGGWRVQVETAGPSTTLHSSPQAGRTRRDDNFVAGNGFKSKRVGWGILRC